jgi:endo-1,3-1,4-beta-glycanase ExoK
VAMEAKVQIRAVVVLLGLAIPVATGASEVPTTGASFVDRFEALDEKRWSVSDGWSNNGDTLCTLARGNIQLGRGLQLALTAQPYNGHAYSCAELQSRDFYGYGTFEVRMRPVSGSGIVSAFFTYTGPHFSKPQDEIDFEFLGRDTHAVQLNFYVAGQGGHETLADLGFDAGHSVNDYAIDWRPDHIRWYINGKMVREVTAEPGKLLPKFPGKIILEVWNSNSLKDWLGPYLPATRPEVADYELVAFTALDAPCQFPQSIVCDQR